MDFAPIKCVFEETDSDKSYQMYELSATNSEINTCQNVAIDLAISAAEGPQWRFQHILFLFSGKGGNYNLKCDVVVCDLNSVEITECQNARNTCIV